MPQSSQTLENVFELMKPDQITTPLVLDSPHSGTRYPEDFAFSCPLETLRAFEDQRVDELFEDAASQNNIPFLKALFPRTYIDPNRAEHDIPLHMIDGHWPHPTTPSARADAGHGLIRETIGAHKLKLYARKLTVEEVRRRITDYYRPYHAALTETLDRTHEEMGFYLHIDCHSMTSAMIAPFHPVQIPDFIIGDMDGTSCSIAFRRTLQMTLIKMGYHVAVNIPYKGVEIVKRYGDPSRGRHSLQLEMNKSLYLDSNNEKIEKKFNKLKSDLENLIQEMRSTLTAHITPMAADE